MASTIHIKSPKVRYAIAKEAKKRGHSFADEANYILSQYVWANMSIDDWYVYQVPPVDFFFGFDDNPEKDEVGKDAVEYIKYFVNDLTDETPHTIFRMPNIGADNNSYGAAYIAKINNNGATFFFSKFPIKWLENAELLQEAANGNS